MKLLIDLFSTDYGLMSITGIAFIIGMGIFFVLYFKRKMDEDTRAAELRRVNAAIGQGNVEHGASH